MDIPIFLSCPSVLNKEQDRSRRLILDELEDLNLEPRALGRSDYPTGLPLREIVALARRCSGGIVLGFEQFVATAGTGKRGTKDQWKVASKGTVLFPTPWNHIEGSILAALELPVIVFCEKGISGGIFDPGVTDIFIHAMPKPPLKTDAEDALREVFLKWQASVRARYYDEFAGRKTLT